MFSKVAHGNQQTVGGRRSALSSSGGGGNMVSCLKQTEFLVCCLLVPVRISRYENEPRWGTVSCGLFHLELKSKTSGRVGK